MSVVNPVAAADLQEDSTVCQLLRELISEVREVKDILTNFTNDGMPINSALPSGELLVAAITTAALLGREKPTISQDDLLRRMQSAQMVATDIIHLTGTYLRQTQAGRLEQLRRQ
jgi:hypothetical protein